MDPHCFWFSQNKKNVGNLEKKERKSWLATSTCLCPDSAAGAPPDLILSSQFAEWDQDLGPVWFTL